ncbi:hypothetical protein E2C01_059327 [Portunus trituberculatus]|uniref:Uncharacterized protein n=1 Tax=Portunus trituberculatus TaxID=210409 RepID=A0A5B7H5J2_PORTR|nr:hypothetical protein [Portunus trituberculatus]
MIALPRPPTVPPCLAVSRLALPSLPRPASQGFPSHQHITPSHPQYTRFLFSRHNKRREGEKERGREEEAGHFLISSSASQNAPTNYLPHLRTGPLMSPARSGNAGCDGRMAILPIKSVRLIFLASLGGLN